MRKFELKSCFRLTDDNAAKVLRLAAKAVTPNLVDEAMDTINKVLEGYGVEAIKEPDAWRRYWLDTGGLYVNMGDTYAPTIIYDVRREKFYLMSWGDFIERGGKRFC